MASIDTKHPLYVHRFPDWEQMRDTHEGERAIKEGGVSMTSQVGVTTVPGSTGGVHGALRYLPPTSGMVDDGLGANEKGFKAYEAYKTRAVYPELVEEAVQGLIGTMHMKPPTIDLPAAMEPMRELATTRGESLEMLLQRINEQQLVMGRVGLMGDVIDEGARSGQPYISLYEALDVINWDEGDRSQIDVLNLNLVVIDETSQVRQPDDKFSWRTSRKHRVLVLGEPTENEPEGEAVYRAALFVDDETFVEGDLETPVLNGNTAREVPFVFVNAVDVVSEPCKPPLLKLSNHSLTIYRGEADYRQSLFMQGQDTLVTRGRRNPDPNEEVRTGAGARLDLELNGDAKYIGVDSTGLVEQREALENDYNRGYEMAGRLLESASRERESGEALTIRVASRTATLKRVAKAGAFGLQMILRKIARWMGLDDQQVVVTPNLDFVDDEMSGEDLAQLQGAKMLGAVISHETIHERMQRKGLTNKTLDEEKQAILAEREDAAFNPPPGEGEGSTSRDGPVDGEDEGEGEGEGDEGEPVGAGASDNGNA